MANIMLYRDFQKYRSVCIKYDFFSAGSNEQYNKVYELMRDKGVSLHDLSLLTWVCSSKYSFAEVVFILENNL